jgi:hypothetical protein
VFPLLYVTIVMLSYLLCHVYEVLHDTALPGGMKTECVRHFCEKL